MDPLLDTMCDLLDEERERQETVLSICIAQGKAARVHDMEYLEAKTAALNILLQEFVEAEQRRNKIVSALMARYHLPPEKQTLSGLIEVLPEPWKSRIKEFQNAMRATLTKTRQAVMDNSGIIQRSMGVVQEAMEALVRCIPAPSRHYDAQGTELGQQATAANLFDQRG